MPGAKSEAIVDATPKLAVRKGDLLRTRHHLQGPRPRERSHRCYVQSSKADVSVLSPHLTLVCLHEAADLCGHTHRGAAVKRYRVNCELLRYCSGVCSNTAVGHAW